MRRYRVPLVDPEDQDLADQFCRLAKTTSDPDHMTIARKPWSLAKEIAKRMGLDNGTKARIKRVDQNDPLDYRRCTIKVRPVSIPRPTSYRVDAVDLDLLADARKMHRQGTNPTNWLARSILARMQGVDRLPAVQRHEWINGNLRDCWRSNLRISENPLDIPAG
jgi:hypothetical protein